MGSLLAPFWLSLLAAGAVWASNSSSVIRIDWEISYQPTYAQAAFALLIVGLLFYKPILGVALAILAGAAFLLWAEHIPLLAMVVAILVFGGALIRLVRVANASLHLVNTKWAVRSTEDELATQEDKHNADASDIVAKHSQMISEIRTFLRARKEYEAAQDDIPIGIQMDEALSSLNDLTFGSIVATLQQCVEIVTAFESRSRSAHGAG